jgi:SAM-dependent methyltransferase
MLRSQKQRCIDFITFPVRAFTLFEEDDYGLSSLATERFDYVARETKGSTLDVGCGRHNRFIKEFLDGNGKGIDVYAYDGLTEENLVEDLTSFPFSDEEFSSVTFIACINHVPRPSRDAELGEAYRVLKPGGNIVITMGNPVAELIVHQVAWFYDKFLGTNVDMDTERGMEEEEEYFLTDSEITERLQKAGFINIQKKYFLTQWGLNHLFTAEKA